MKYRRRQEYVEAYQWLGHEHPDQTGAIRPFRGLHVPKLADCQRCGLTMMKHGWIEDNRQLFYDHSVCPGDYLVLQDGFYVPMRQDNFEMFYEVDDDTVVS